ncbi:Rrf2 family transcriptional regulator [Lactobacillus sp. S2-2]|uniref:RrF2 family transcriptional regulator n=1 Tax=Lactobacillus sp. S2-2 TaxID=2692917 RepID=UPI001F26CBEA|nr:Rrf2 family transcriptional regulator [Lactobacillus sp. S2-2]MCF6515447.1 Rrf2 family transcriptional regulator [Lactobacillus sp. S2-2]
MAYSKAFSQSIAILSYIEVGSKLEDCDYISIKDISNNLAIPIPTIKKLIAMLKKSELLITKAGIDGGLHLAKSASEISLYDIFFSVEGNLNLFSLYKNYDATNIKFDKKNIETIIDHEEKILNNIDNKVINHLKEVNLNDILN